MRWNVCQQYSHKWRSHLFSLTPPLPFHWMVPTIFFFQVELVEKLEIIGSIITNIACHGALFDATGMV